MTLLGKLDALKREHDGCAFCRMPCNLADERLADRGCNCGADDHNARLAEVRAEVERLVAERDAANQHADYWFARYLGQLTGVSWALSDDTQPCPHGKSPSEACRLCWYTNHKPAPDTVESLRGVVRAARLAATPSPDVLAAADEVLRLAGEALSRAERAETALGEERKHGGRLAEILECLLTEEKCAAVSRLTAEKERGVGK